MVLQGDNDKFRHLVPGIPPHNFSNDSDDISLNSFSSATVLRSSQNNFELHKEYSSDSQGSHESDGHGRQQHSTISRTQYDGQNDQSLPMHIPSPQASLQTSRASTRAIKSTKKKITRQRRISSCIACRDKKVKCDKKKPDCSTCIKYGIECSYIEISTPSLSRSSKISKNKNDAQNDINRTSPVSSFRSVVDNDNFLTHASSPKALNYESTTENQYSPPSNISSSPSITGTPVFIPCSAPGSSVDFNGKVCTSENIIPASSSGQLLNVEGHVRYSQTYCSLSIASVITSSSARPGAKKDKYIPFYYKSFQDISSQYPNVFKCLPAVPEMRILIEAYFETFHKIFCLIEPVQFRKDVEEFYKDPSAVGWNKLSLIISVLFTGIQFCPLEKLSSSLSNRREEIIVKLRNSTEACLARAEFLSKFDINCLSAWLLLVFYFQAHGVSRNCALLQLPVVLRLSQGIGLHRDPAHFTSYSFAEREIRRRLWTCLCHLDVFGAMLAGVEPVLSCDSFDSKLPLLLNDAELVEGSDYGGKYNQGHELISGLYWPVINDRYRYTDTTLLFVIGSSSNIFRRLFRRFTAIQPRPFADDLAAVLHIKSVFQKIFDGIDHNVPIQRITFCIGQMLVGRMMVYLYLPYIEYDENCLSLEAREHIILSSLYCLEYVLELLKSPYGNILFWSTRRFSQIEHMFFVLTKLEFDPNWRLKEYAWNIVIRNYAFFKQGHFSESTHGWKMAEILIGRVAIALGKADDPQYQASRRMTPGRTYSHENPSEQRKGNSNVPQNRLPVQNHQYSQGSTPSVGLSLFVDKKHSLSSSSGAYSTEYDKSTNESSLISENSVVTDKIDSYSVNNAISSFSFGSSSLSSSIPQSNLANLMPTNILPTTPLKTIKSIRIPFSILSSVSKPLSNIQSDNEFSIGSTSGSGDSGGTNGGGYDGYVHYRNQQDFAPPNVELSLSDVPNSSEKLNFVSASMVEERVLTDPWLGHVDRNENFASSESKGLTNFVTFDFDNEQSYVDWSEWDKMVQFIQHGITN